jgi:hypothetical protein
MRGFRNGLAKAFKKLIPIPKIFLRRAIKFPFFWLWVTWGVAQIISKNNRIIQSREQIT